MESAPQSTIAHNTFIDFASDPGLPHTAPRERRAHKKKACPAQRAALNRRDHAKIASATQRYGRPKPTISAGICVQSGFFQEYRLILEMAVGGSPQRDLPALRIEESWGRRPCDHGSNRG